MRPAPALLLLGVGLTAQAAATPAQPSPCGNVDALIERVDQDFRQGRLDAALAAAEHGLSCPDATTDQRVALYLKLSGIHDRTGLHNNSRPVAAALQSVESAFALASRAGPGSRAAIELARARYFYRAEQPDSNYPRTRAAASDALARFEKLGDLHGVADVVHLSGLLHLQRRELDEAQKYFEHSFELEMQTESPRPVMLADYERHVGYVQQLSGDWAAAIESFERSFSIRRANGLRDQAMFAAISLGRALVAADRAAEAEAPLDFALTTAAELDSAEGRARTVVVLRDMFSQPGDRQEAFEVTITTGAGDIRIQLYPDRAPVTAANFLRLVNGGHLEGGTFYRVVSPANDNGSPVISVIQGGIGDRESPFAPILHETTADTGLLHVDGAVSMARAGPGTATTEFFICIGDQPALDFGGTRNADGEGFAVFGRVVDGMDVVHAIHESAADAPTDNEYLKGQLLSEPVIVQSVRRID